MVPPRSSLIGDVVFPGMVTDAGDTSCSRIQRKGEARPGDPLAVGDTLLLRGSWAALDENPDDPNVLVVDAPDLVRRQAVPLGPGVPSDRGPGRHGRPAGHRARPVGRRGPAGGQAMVLLRVVTPEGAYRSISWTTVVLVAGMIRCRRP